MAVPIVKNIPEELQLFHKSISEKVAGHKSLQQFFNDINWLKKEIGQHDTVDTFAKKLFLTKKFKELNKLKALLSCYFTWRQATKDFDKRYDTFIASLAERRVEVKLPDNIRILTWNYDMQLEIAFSEYIANINKQLTYREDTIMVFSDYFDIVSDALHSRPYISGYEAGIDNNRFAHVRLNGLAGS